MTICSVDGCGREVYEGDKCIFHCDKRDWYVEDDKGNRDWSKSEEKCKKFWGMFEEEFKEDIKYHDFTNMVFPIDTFFSFSSSRSRDERKEFKKSLIFSNSIFLDKFSFKDCFFLESVGFVSCVFERKMFFVNSYFLGASSFFLNFTEASFYSTVYLSFQEKSSSFQKCHIILDGAKTINGSILSIEGNGFEPFSSKNVRDLNVRFASVTFEEKNWFYFNSVFFDDCKFKANTYIMEDYENEEKYKRSEIIFSNPTFEENVSVFIENIAVDSFKLAYFTNSAKIFRLTDVCVNSELSFYHSNLAGVEFNNFDVSKAEEINLENASFIGSNGYVNFNGVKWGKELSYRLKGITRDIMRQLKHVYDLQGNIIDGNFFYSLEMNEYRKEKKDWKQAFIFWVGKISSDFLQCWYLPIFWYLLLGIFLARVEKIVNIFNIKEVASDFYFKYLLFLMLFSGCYICITFSFKRFSEGLKKKGLFFILYLFFLGLCIWFFHKFWFFFCFPKPCFFTIVVLIATVITIFPILCKDYSNLEKTKKIELILFDCIRIHFKLILCLLIVLFFLYLSMKDESFMNFVNPFNTDIEKIGSGKIVKFSFIFFKIISVFLGYQLITSLRHYTRRK